MQEIQSYLENKIEYLQSEDEKLNIGISKRTIERDFEEMRKLFGCDIQYSKKYKGYFIEELQADNNSFQQLLNAFDVFNALGIAQDLLPFVQTDQRTAKGTEHLYGLLHAIRNKLTVGFTYEKFWADTLTERTVEPYALKEYKDRWYLMAKEEDADHLKSFALDRITGLYINNDQKFTLFKFNIEEQYHYCFGIITPDDNQEPQDIVLSFHPEQGKYIKTMPLHHTQQILADGDDEMRIALKLYITFDFLMELLSFGEYVKVMQPHSLVNEIKEMHEHAADLYKK